MMRGYAVQREHEGRQRVWIWELRLTAPQLRAVSVAQAGVWAAQELVEEQSPLESSEGYPNLKKQGDGAGAAWME